MMSFREETDRRTRADIGVDRWTGFYSCRPLFSRSATLRIQIKRFDSKNEHSEVNRSEFYTNWEKATIHHSARADHILVLSVLATWVAMTAACQLVALSQWSRHSNLYERISVENNVIIARETVVYL